MRVNGELFGAQLENLTADPAAGVVGRAWMRTDLGDVKVSTAALVKNFLLNDQNIVVGTHATANTNARLYRSGTAQLALVLGGDTTAEASLAAPTSWAQLAHLLPTDTYANIAALARKAGALFYSSDRAVPYWDNGTTLSPLSVGQPRNYIINGGMDFWQRVHPYALTGSASQYVADRWRGVSTTSGAVSCIRATDVPTLSESGYQSTYSFQIDVTTADTPGAAEALQLNYCVEGFDYAELKGKQVTLQFWVKSTKTGIFSVAFQNSVPDRYYIAEYTVNTTNTWEQKSVTLTLNPSGGTDDFTNGTGLRIIWTIGCGSNFHGTTGSWQTGTASASANQVNGLDSTSNNWYLTQVSLTISPVAVAFSRCGRNIQEELALCQRYYEKSYYTTSAPGALTNDGSETVRANSTNLVYSNRMKVTKRNQPSVVLYSTNDGAAGNIYDLTAGANVADTADQIGTSGFRVSCTVNADQDLCLWHWTADAELT